MTRRCLCRPHRQRAVVRMAAASLVGTILFLLLAGVLAAQCTLGATPQIGTSAPTASSAKPTVGNPAPTFRLTDVQGRAQTLESLRGKAPAALFFFCGCTACADVAREWARLQKTLQSKTSSPSAVEKEKASQQSPKPAPPTVRPLTIIVFSGEATEAKELAVKAGLDPTQTTLLCDPTLAVTLGTYQVEPCPRVFVLDSNGRIRYTNTDPEDVPQESPGKRIAANALEQLHAASTAAAASPAPTVPALPTNKPTADSPSVPAASVLPSR